MNITTLTHCNLLHKTNAFINRNKSYAQKLKGVNIFNPALKYINNGARLSQKNPRPISEFLKDKIKIIDIKRKDKTKNISAWYINPQNSENVVFYVHGLGKNITDYQSLYEKIVKMGLGVFAVEYRGHGFNPTTKVTEKKLNYDLNLAYKNLIKEQHIKPENIVVVGHSLGGALSTSFTKSHKKVKSLVLISPMCNIFNLGEKFVQNPRIGFGVPAFMYKLADKFPLLKWIQNSNFNSLKKISKFDVPTSIVQSKNDAVTSLKGAEKLVKAANEHGNLNKYVFLEKGGHAIESGKEDAVISMLEKIYQLPQGIKSLDENV